MPHIAIGVAAPPAASMSYHRRTVVVGFDGAWAVGRAAGGGKTVKSAPAGVLRRA
jgi:hypothetical protein